MTRNTLKNLISAAGLVFLAVIFAIWLGNTDSGTPGKLAAALSIGLFALICLRFVPRWLDFWGDVQPQPVPVQEGKTAKLIFVLILLWDILLIVTVYLIRKTMGSVDTLIQSLSSWLYLDSHHYLDIARDWYLSEGEWDRLVQLVFFPGYPVAVRLMHVIIPDYTLAGFAVSALCFAGSGVMLYKLARLDCGRDTALFAVAILCVVPGSFFFAAPMSESLFMLCSLSCIYLVRTKRTLAGCVLGAYAAFTRSLGVLLVAPVLFELIAERRKLSDYVKMLIIPLGLAGYLLINYLVAGDPLKFMEYQSGHWGQRLGWFFNTAAYQYELMGKAYGSNDMIYLGLWLPNLLAQFFALAVMLTAAKKLRPSYTVHFIAYFAVAIGATWLLSAPRYLAAMTALPIAVAVSTEGSDKMRRTAITASFLFNLLYIFCFCNRWQVW